MLHQQDRLISSKSESMKEERESTIQRDQMRQLRHQLSKQLLVAWQIASEHVDLAYIDRCRNDFNVRLRSGQRIRIAVRR